MNSGHLSRLLAHYDQQICTLFPAVEPYYKGSPKQSPLLAQASHLRWMIQEATGFLEQGRLDRTNRWVGFIEGSFVQLGLTTLEDIQRFDVESSFPSA